MSDSNFNQYYSHYREFHRYRCLNHSNIIKLIFINIASPILDRRPYLDHSNNIKRTSIHSHYQGHQCHQLQTPTKKRSIDLEPVYDYVEIISLDVTRAIAQCVIFRYFLQTTSSMSIDESNSLCSNVNTQTGSLNKLYSSIHSPNKFKKITRRIHLFNSYNSRDFLIHLLSYDKIIRILDY